MFFSQSQENDVLEGTNHMFSSSMITVFAGGAFFGGGGQGGEGERGDMGRVVVSCFRSGFVCVILPRGSGECKGLMHQVGSLQFFSKS